MFQLARHLRRDRRGSALVELAVALPLLLLLLVAAIDLGRYAYERAQAENTAHQAAQFSVLTADPSADYDFESIKRNYLLANSLKDCARQGSADGCQDWASAGVRADVFVTCDCYDSAAPSCSYGAPGQICPNGQAYRYYFNVRISRPFRRLIELDFLPLPAEIVAESRHRMQ
ncbi:MAG: pilus assembly protein [Alphaproteobacteria bacterium]|nr:pilus assembly protein [Alphaproteobacteria bacterium]